MTNEPLAVTFAVIDVLDKLEIPYVIGGSLASTLHGVMRTTIDSAIVADVRPQHVAELLRQLQPTFYLSADAVLDALIHQGSFNLIHQGTLFKVDIFLPKERSFERNQLAHRTAYLLAENPEQRAYVASAEETILAKLEWYRVGGESSERQWRDVVGIVRVQGERLDWKLLRRVAPELAVADLLGKLWEEVSPH
jgi:hypothetical protein